MRQVLKRYEGNPIISPKDMPYPCEHVYNSGATRYKGKYLLLLRCGRLHSRSEFGLATSDDGFHFQIHPEPVMKQATEGIFAKPENKGIEDPRITQIGDDYYIFYSCYSTRGFQIGLARTRDFQKIERMALTTAIDYRNCVLFPEKINGTYVRFERPNWGSPSIWISYSPDLIHWGNQQQIMAPISTDIWQDGKIGPCVPPIKTPRGWLNIYHGVTHTMAGCIYRLGVAVHDLADPRKVIGRARQFILAPEALHERVGYVPNVVFSCGAVPEPDGTIKLYYGSADTVMNVATGRIDDLIDLALEDGPDTSV
ncbi:MAG: glycoside hydrolase family 130 protein [Kiritimatiellae bacterium]|nr:glycoside hydrolase family 130 protein [Kiritimatiellia bacterium]